MRQHKPRATVYFSDTTFGLIKEIANNTNQSINAAVSDILQTCVHRYYAQKCADYTTEIDRLRAFDNATTPPKPRQS